MDDGAVGVEFRRRVAAVVGELLDQVLVRLAEQVFGHARPRERLRREVLDEVVQRPSERRSLFVQGASPKMPLSMSGLALSMACMAC